MKIKTSENGKTTDAILYHIAKDLFEFFNGFDCLHETKKQIIDRCKIEMQAGRNCWSADVIEKAWKETKITEKNHQEHWAFVIMMQVIKSLICDKCKQNPAQEESGPVSKVVDLGSNVKRKCDLGSTEKCKKEHPEDRSSQSTAEQDTMGTAGRDEQHSGGKHQTTSSGQTIYIRVPFLEMIPNEQHEGERVQNVISDYKLIAGLPGPPVNSEIRRRKSYVMSFNHETRNANWVYEILNGDTVPERPVKAAPFEDPYHRGHLAAAANHRWCWEALDDANMNDNIVPQHKTLNTGPWKSSENCCRKRATAEIDIRNVHMYSGPIYPRDRDPLWIQGKQVPSHFFKVIIEENVDGRVNEPRCYLFPNQDLSSQENRENVEQYRMIGTRDLKAITIEDIQNDSGLTFIDIRQNAEARKITGTLHGKYGTAEPRTAEIQVIICN